MFHTATARQGEYLDREFNVQGLYTHARQAMLNGATRFSLRSIKQGTSVDLKWTGKSWKFSNSNVRYSTLKAAIEAAADQNLNEIIRK